MRINTPGDGRISIDDDKPFVEKEDVVGGEKAAAYTIEGPEGYLIGVESGTSVAPAFRDENGNPLDGSTRVTIQKADRQGNPLGRGIVFSELLSRFNFAKMRTDPDFFRNTDRDLMIDEREIVHVFVEVPDGEPGFNADQSTLTIGDETSDFGKPVEIVSHNSLSTEQMAAVQRASTASGGN